MTVKDLYKKLGYLIKENPEVEDKGISAFIPLPETKDELLPSYTEHQIEYLVDDDYTLGLYCKDKTEE